jgi:hypothetical protein
LIDCKVNQAMRQSYTAAFYLLIIREVKINWVSFGAVIYIWICRLTFRKFMPFAIYTLYECTLKLYPRKHGPLKTGLLRGFEKLQKRIYPKGSVPTAKSICIS